MCLFKKEKLSVVLFLVRVTEILLTSASVFFYAERVLGALGLNLELKARVYEAPTLSSLFLLNNYNYIVKTLQRYEYCMNTKLCLLEQKEAINTSCQGCQPPQVIGDLSRDRISWYRPWRQSGGFKNSFSVSLDSDL